jgi:hypothetical protein
MTRAVFPLLPGHVRALFDRMATSAPALRLLTSKSGGGGGGKDCGGGRSVNIVNFRQAGTAR